MTLVTKRGALAMRGGGSQGRISCTRRVSMPYSSAATRKLRHSGTAFASRAVAADNAQATGISSVELKVDMGAFVGG